MKRDELKTWARKTFAIQDRFDEITKWAFEKRFPIIVLILLGIAALLLSRVLKELFLIAAFIGLGGFSMFYNRFIRTSLGFELITLGVVITGLLYGPAIAVFVGFFSLLLAELITGSLQHKTIVSFVGIITIGILTQLFKNTPITTAGIAITLIYDLIIVPGYLLLGSNPLRTGLFLVTHLAFNFWVFTTIAPPLFELLH